MMQNLTKSISSMILILLLLWIGVNEVQSVAISRQVIMKKNLIGNDNSNNNLYNANAIKLKKRAGNCVKKSSTLSLTSSSTSITSSSLVTSSIELITTEASSSFDLSEWIHDQMTISATYVTAV